MISGMTVQGESFCQEHGGREEPPSTKKEQGETKGRGRKNFGRVWTFGNHRHLVERGGRFFWFALVPRSGVESEQTKLQSQ